MAVDQAPKPAPPPSAARIPILIKYARLYPSGARRPMTCGPHHKTRKVIFDDAERAQLAAAALAELDGGQPQRTYPCPLSRSGHFHLTRDLEGQ